MLKNKKSKVLKMRGTNSHGWGHKKKHRGAGHRGGVGLSGTGARGDAKKSAVLKNSKTILQIIAAQKGVPMSSIKAGPGYFGKRGFHSIHKKKNKFLTLNYIEQNFDFMIESGMIEKKGTKLILDTTKFKIDKVLANGTFSKKIQIIAKEISAPAKEKIQKAGSTFTIFEKKSK